MGAAPQYATTGHVDWGLKGVAGAAIAGAVGAATGIGVGAMAAGWGIGAGGAAAVGGAAGGAAGGATGTAVGGGSLSAIGSSALTGAICGAVGGAIGVSAGSQSLNASTAFGGSMVGTAYGTASGLAWGALTGDAPTWQSAGIAFGAAFGGAIASTALSSGVQENTEGRAAETARNARANDDGPPISEGRIVPGEPITDPRIREECWKTWTKSDLGSMRAHEEGFATQARFENGNRVFGDPVAAEPSITLAEAQQLRETPSLRRMPTLAKGAPQDVDVHSHPFPEGTEVYVDRSGVTQRASAGPSWGDVGANAIQRALGRNQMSYVLAPEGIYRIIGTNVERIAPISYIHPGNR